MYAEMIPVWHEQRVNNECYLIQSPVFNNDLESGLKSGCSGHKSLLQFTNLEVTPYGSIEKPSPEPLNIY